MTEPPHDVTRATFDDAAVVAFYETFHPDLFPCEREVFSRVLRDGIRILDLGVGAGRTTGVLASHARRYVGVDYSPRMIAACRARFGGEGAAGDVGVVEFVEADASDLSMFDDGSFDLVVFSFNGIDCLHPDAARLRCLAECHRVLSARGVLLFSSHNPRSLVVRSKPGPGGAARAKRFLRAAVATLRWSARALRTRAFWVGEGYVHDPVHGGMVLHAATRAKVVAEVHAAGFEVVGPPVGNDFPHRSRPLVTNWSYHVFEKPPAHR